MALGIEAREAMDYQVKLETFQGPLDLLLYLVKRQEVDIFDIAIARVTDQFLDHLRVLELIDVEQAGEFLVMAATLMEIKSRLLLPRTEGTGEEEADPRMELVKQLIEYKKFKDATVLLDAQAEQQLTRLPRQTLEPLHPTSLAHQPLRAVDLWDLVSAFGRLMRETLALQPQQIVVDQTPMQVYMEAILEHLTREHRLPFSALFTPPYERSRLIGLFLAILELIKDQQIQVEQADCYGEIWVERVPQTDSLLNGSCADQPIAGPS